MNEFVKKFKAFLVCLSAELALRFIFFVFFHRVSKRRSRNPGYGSAKSPARMTRFENSFLSFFMKSGIRAFLPETKLFRSLFKELYIQYLNEKNKFPPVCVRGFNTSLYKNPRIESYINEDLAEEMKGTGFDLHQFERFEPLLKNTKTVDHLYFVLYPGTGEVVSSNLHRDYWEIVDIVAKIPSSELCRSVLNYLGFVTTD